MKGQLYTAMNKFILFVGIAFALLSCETMTSTNTLDTEFFSFLHAGKNISLPVEIVEKRTSKRRGPIFGGRDVTFDYAFVVKSENGDKLFEFPCNKESEIKDFTSELQIKRSKDRKHFALGIGDETIAIYYVFKKFHFVGYAHAQEGETQNYSFAAIDFDEFDEPRDLLRDHINGDQLLPIIDETTLVEILCSLPPEDKLNREAISLITSSNPAHKLSVANEKKLLNHCKSSSTWRKKAYESLKDNKDDLDDESYIRKLFVLAGQQAVEKEDWAHLKIYPSTNNSDYFSMRLAMHEPKLKSEIKGRFKAMLEKSVYNVCQLSDKEVKNILTKIRLLEKMDSQHTFEKFVEKYEQSKCKRSTIHEVNNALMFMSDLKSSEKSRWVAFMIRNFEFVSPPDRSWDYDRIKDELSCKDKRAILLKYRKDIDVFNDMEIPICE